MCTKCELFVQQLFVRLFHIIEGCFHFSMSVACDALARNFYKVQFHPRAIIFVA